METLYKKDGTPIKIMTDEDMKAINLVPYINKADWYEIHTAYCVNRVITITLLVKKGTVNTNETQLINDERYYPLGDVFGIVNIQSSVMDVGKILDTRLRSTGNVYMWIGESLSYGELVTFIYPLKS